MQHWLTFELLLWLGFKAPAALQVRMRRSERKLQLALGHLPSTAASKKYGRCWRGLWQRLQGSLLHAWALPSSLPIQPTLRRKGSHLHASLCIPWPAHDGMTRERSLLHG